MKRESIQDAIKRITHMERCFDILEEAMRDHPAALHEDERLKALLLSLTQYYEGGQWLWDYELDEKGLLPQELKRGVMAQDAVYDLLERIKQIDYA